MARHTSLLFSAAVYRDLYTSAVEEFSVHFIQDK